MVVQAVRRKLPNPVCRGVNDDPMALGLLRDNGGSHLLPGGVGGIVTLPAARATARKAVFTYCLPWFSFR